ncbi:MAG: tetratricopeptide repeat protein, partial [Candidatus Hodarchaeota archaeon]
IFTLGIIYYELLTGKLPYQAETILESLMRRTEEPARPVTEVDPSIPKAMSDIVQKCMAMDPAERYQSAAELLHELDIVTGDYKPVTRFWKWTATAAGVLLVTVVVGGIFFRDRLFKPPEEIKPVTVLVADFNNATGDPVFGGTLEPMFKIAMEGAGFVNAFDRTQLRSLGVAATDKLDEAAARQIAISQGLGTVISGSIERRGAGYRLSVRAIQPVTGNPIATADASARDKDQVLTALTKVATAVREELGDDTSGSAQRFAMETITAGSLEAVHEYAMGMNHLSNGKFEDALQSLSAAVELDPKFGLAYAVMASASRNLGRSQDAEKYIKLAIAHIDRMTERERYRTRGFYYLLKSDLPKCVEEYGALIARYSSDVAAHNNLAFCAADLRNIPKAIQETRQAAEILPKRSLYRGNLAIYLAFAGDFQAAEKEARAALQLDPSSAPGFIGLAYAQVGQGQLLQAADTYKKLEKVGAFGSIAASGLADLALYEGRFADAARILEEGAASDLAAKNLGRAADKFAALAYTRALQGRKAAALTAAESALANSNSPKIMFLAARIFVEAGELARARELAADLDLELQTEPQVYAKLIEGEIAIKRGDARQAIKIITEGNKQLDTWIGRFDLGRAYLEAEAFAEADSEFDRCIKRRGEALALFLNEVPSYGYFPPVYYYLGRVREGLGSAGFAESYRTYLSIREKAGEDPLLAEVRRRADR